MSVVCVPWDKQCPQHFASSPGAFLEGNILDFFFPMISLVYNRRDAVAHVALISP